MTDEEFLGFLVVNARTQTPQTLSQAATICREAANLTAKFHYRKGSSVSFLMKSGEMLTGTIERINQKTATVRVGPYRSWRVPMTMLKDPVTSSKIQEGDPVV